MITIILAISIKMWSAFGLLVWFPLVAQWWRICLPMKGDAGDKGSIPGLGRSSGGGSGDLFQYSCLWNPMAEQPSRLQSIELQSQIQLSMQTHISLHGSRSQCGNSASTFQFFCFETEEITTDMRWGISRSKFYVSTNIISSCFD